MATGSLSRIVSGADQLSRFQEQQKLSPLRRQSAEIGVQGQQFDIELAKSEFSKSKRLNDLFEVAAIPSAQRLPFLQQKRQEMAQAGEDIQGIDALLALPDADRDARIDQGVQFAQQQGIGRADPRTSLERNVDFLRRQETPEARAEVLAQTAARPRIETIGGAPSLVNVGTGQVTQLGTAEAEIAAKAGEAGAVKKATLEAQEEVERPQRELKARKRSAAIRQAGNTVVQDLGRALELLPDMVQGKGIIGANARLVKSKIAGSSEANILKFIDSALSNVGLDRLQQMRESSPTGGALGQVPIAQQLRLEKVLGSLDLGQRPDVIESNIKRVMNVYFDIMNGDTQERQSLVDSGQMSQAEFDRVEDLRFDLPFDELGRKVSAQTRFEQLQKEKRTPAEIFDILKAEGFK